MTEEHGNRPRTLRAWLSLLIKRLLPLAIVVLAIAVTVTLVTMRPQPESLPQQERSIRVELLPLAQSDVVVSIQSQGTVLPRTETTLVAEVSGVVRTVSDKLAAGGFVRQGEVLLSLDDADYRVAVDQAQASLLSARAQLTLEQAQSEQAAREWDMSGRPRENAPLLALRTPYLREAEARVLYAESELARAQRQLERTHVRAPYDAMVRERIADIGQFLGTGAQVARVFATDYAEVRLPLSANDLAWLQLPPAGSDAARPVPVKFSARVAGRTDQWLGQIVRMEAVVDSTSRMHYAVARIDDPYALRPDAGQRKPLLAGTFVQAAVQGVTIPAVYRVPPLAMNGQAEVLVMDVTEHLRRRQVNVVRTDADWVYVDSGLLAGDQAIVSPVQVPVDGMRVIVGSQ